MLNKSKKEWILKYIQDKKVLDLGCVQHDLVHSQDPNWLHGIVVKHARSVVGVDILEKEIEIMRQRGYNVVCSNVEKMDLKDTFEVVIAGDLIEHLSNPGLFLDRVNQHLTPDGIFLLTTPNPITLMRFLQLIFTGRVGTNSEHTSWFTIQVINELARRSQMRVVESEFVDDAYQYYDSRSILWKPFLLVNYIVCRIWPQLSETLCLVLKHALADDKQNLGIPEIEVELESREGLSKQLAARQDNC